MTSRPPEPPSRDEPPPPGGTGRKRGRVLQRMYVIASGPEEGERAPIDLVTLIVARADPTAAPAPEQAAVLRLCRSPLSTAELSAYLNLPFSVVTVLLGELLAAELVQARAPVVRGAVADRSLLEAVIHGLQKL